MIDRRRSLALAPILTAVCMAVLASCASRDNPPERPRAPEVERPAALPETPPAADRGPAPFPPLPPVGVEPEVSPACLLMPEPGTPIATVALMEPVDPGHAPRPVNASERLLFRQLYETLVRVDCDGHPMPALAATWRLAGDGRTWIVSLRQGARFADGTFVTAGAVLAAWSLPDGSALRPESLRLLAGATALDSRTLAVVPRGAWGEAPLGLAHTDLAVAAPAGDAAWPLGTRSAHASSAPDGASVIVAREADSPTGATSELRFAIVSGRDGRDPLDRGVDLLVTRDPSTLAYAAALGRFRRVPLAWQRTRVLLTPGRGPASTPPTIDARRALAVDAVRGEARGAEGPYWWDGARCEAPAARAPRPPPPTTGAVVYDASDAAGRELAERIVGLLRARGGATSSLFDGLPLSQPLRAVGLTGEVLSTAVRRGGDAGYVLALERRSVDACAALDELLAAAPWLRAEAIVPLVDTRPQAIVSQGRAGATVDWDGTLVLAGPSAR